MKVKHKAQELTLKKKDFYCKAGEFNHKWRTGWVAVNSDGVAVLGDMKIPRNRTLGSARHDYPQFLTRRALIDFYQLTPP